MLEFWLSFFFQYEKFVGHLTYLQAFSMYTNQMIFINHGKKERVINYWYIVQTKLSSPKYLNISPAGKGALFIKQNLRFGLIWSDLVWFDLIWSDLVWSWSVGEFHLGVSLFQSSKFNYGSSCKCFWTRMAAQMIQKSFGFGHLEIGSFEYHTI